jgi:DNA-binding CsgD family transcriptional regulator
MFGPERPATTSPGVRRTGIEALGQQPWGTHVSLFYESTEDLLDVHAKYLGAGLADGEFCIWALPGPLDPNKALKSLRNSIPDFECHLRQNRIELIPGYDWYRKGGDFDARRIIDEWYKKLDQALARGLAGMRASGDAFWCQRGLWQSFCEYEAELDSNLLGRRMIVLCTYSLGAARAADMLDVARKHDISISIRNGQWEFLESAVRVDSTNSVADVLSSPFPGKEYLTDREKLVLMKLIGGFSSKQAARELKISPRTVDFHRANIMRKLGVRNFAELLGIVLRTR